MAMRCESETSRVILLTMAAFAVTETFENYNDTIINYIKDRLTNASAESFYAKIKTFRTQFRGEGDIKFFIYRLATLYS